MRGESESSRSDKDRAGATGSNAAASDGFSETDAPDSSFVSSGSKGSTGIARNSSRNSNCCLLPGASKRMTCVSGRSFRSSFSLRSARLTSIVGASVESRSNAGGPVPAATFTSTDALGTGSPLASAPPSEVIFVRILATADSGHVALRSFPTCPLATWISAPSCRSAAVFLPAIAASAGLRPSTRIIGDELAIICAPVASIPSSSASLLATS